MYVPDDDAETAEETTNIGLIAGASVGGVVVLAIIGFAVYKYRKSKEEVTVDVEVIEDNSLQEGPSKMKISP